MPIHGRQTGDTQVGLANVRALSVAVVTGHVEMDHQDMHTVR